MSRYWSPLVSRLSPYVPGEQPRGRNFVKLNTNELPWPPSPAALACLRDADGDTLRLYPDPDSVSLREAWARQAGVEPGQVFVGNGSDEVLAHTFQGLFQPASPVLFPDITYSFYPVYCELFGLDYQRPPLADDYSIDLGDYRRQNGGIIFPNPNAPTGIPLSLEAIEALLADNPDTVVVVDEAYVDFGAESAVPLVRDWPNLLVIQTLSKSRGLAGVRVGAAFGDRVLIEGLERVKNSFNSYPLDRLAQAVGIAALEDEDWFEDSCARLVALREQLRERLVALGFEVLPSAANFLFARHRAYPGAELASELREKGLLVRHFPAPRIDEFLRITVGAQQECAALVAALEEILAP
jgi:histidinol-phosphate aminotransferase